LEKGWRRMGLGVECVSRRKFEIMIWGCISYNGVGILAFAERNLNANRYQNILENHLWPVIAKYFPSNNFIF